MMLHRNLGKIILAAIICAAALYLIIPLDFMLKEEPHSPAFVPHENPETAEEVFGGIPPFMFDPDYLNFVLHMNPEEVKAMIRKRPFSHIYQRLKEAMNNFDASMAYISDMIVEIDEDLSKLRALMGQYRFDEATRLVDETSAKLSQANRELKRVEETAKSTGTALKVSLATPRSDWRRSYDELLERIRKGKETLDLDKDILANFSKTLAVELPNLTEVTLKIEPMVAFVGDNIRFMGVLTSEGKPLAGRDIDIFINGFQYVTVKTDGFGYYQGMLQVPYLYISEMDLQALYRPGDEDIGLHPFSLSPVIKVKALFYEAVLELTVQDKALPGLETMITGRFHYGQSPPLNERKTEIYFDDVLITEAVEQEAFTQKIRIDPEAGLGEHIITVSSAAVGRYSPVVTDVLLNVTGVTPILDLNIPKVAMIPGSVRLEGKLYSEVGPLSEASIKMGLGKSQVELVSSEDGTFDTKIKVGMGFGVVGSQDLVIQVFPQEPWYAPLNTKSSVLMVNVVNCGAFVAMILFLGIYLPGRLRRRLGAYPRRTARPAIAMALPESVPTYSERLTALTLTEDSDETSKEPRNRIFYWYRLVVRLLQGITKALLGPQQTLREFAKESSDVLGPAAKYFIELTKTVERLLYSQYRPTESDVAKSKQLSHNIEEETKLRVTTQPLLARQVRGKGTGDQFEPNEISVAGGARAFDFGGRVSTTSPWRQPSTWLWVLLILAVAYYACLLLFLLPLLVISAANCLPLVIADDLRDRETKAVTKEESKGEGV